MPIMLRSIRLVQVGLIVALCIVLPACHKGSSGSSTATAFVRVVNATPNGSLGLALNQNVTSNNVVTNVVTNVATNVAAGSASGYVAVIAGGYSSTVTDANGLASSTIPLGLGGTYYSVIVSERDGAIRQNWIADNQVPPAGGFTSFVAPNYSLDAGPLDIYVVATTTTTLAGLQPAFSAVNYGSLVSPQLIVAGTYTIIVTANGNQGDVRLTLPSVVFSGTEILTLALTATAGGGLVNGVLIQQGSTVQVVPASTARVRVVAALAPSSTVSATVGTIVLADVASPNYGSYTLVPGPSTSSAISVGGTPVASLPATTFAAGGDYTILVYGSASTPTATVLTDINQTVGSDAVLRLVNAAVSPDGVFLTYNFSPVASNVLLGAVSGNVGVPPSNSSTVTISSAGATISCLPSYCTNVNLESGGVYTYFVLNPSAPEVILSRDR
jgi:hypothetical protein